MLLSDRVPIFFDCGNYGHYLNWVLNNFTTRGRRDYPELPFLKNGRSITQYDGATPNNFWTSMKVYNKYPFFSIYYNDLRSNISDNDLIIEVANSVDKVLAVRYDPSMQLLTINNWFYRRSTNLGELIDNLSESLELGKLNKDSSTAEIRELFSYKFFNDAHQLGRTALIRPNIKLIEVHELLYNFEDVITSTVDFLDTELTVPIKTIMENHSTMVALQSNINKDDNMREFLDKFTNHIDWPLPDDCNLVDEAYIQYFLRDQLHLSLRCNDIGDDFPKTTNELWNYTY